MRHRSPNCSSEYNPIIQPGEHLGPYEIVARLGAGGMGEVWRARDARLGRDVAIKVLPPETANDGHLRERFQREAKIVARLNHPHICTLYDVGDDYLVMELLDGETLSDRLKRGPMPLDDVIRYGAQIAEALDRAHRAGIVHRDLKPGNMMLTKSGVKLLDFGLAKSTGLAVRHEDAILQKPLTEAGTIVGTMQYMAPEQLRGEAVDSRTDIFALGAVLYEMTTAKPAFDAPTPASVIAAILSSSPKPMSELQPNAPAALEHVIERCLARDPDDRWQSAHDIAEDLKWIAAPRRGRKRRTWPSWAAWTTGIVAVAAIAVAAWLVLKPRPRPELIDAAIAIDGNSGPRIGWGPPVFSPDGRTIAYSAADASGRPKLWLRSMKDGTTRALAGTDDGAFPFWSPDGRFLAFLDLATYALKKIAIRSGEITTIVTKTSGGWTWSRDGVILFETLPSPASHNSFRSLRGFSGESELVLEAASIGATAIGWPVFLPDGNRFLFVALGGVEKRGQAGIWVGTLDRSEKPRFLTRAGSHVVYVEPGYLLYARDGVLRARRFDADTATLSGEEAAIAPVHQIQQSYYLAAQFGASDSGLIVYQTPGDALQSEIVLKSRKGEILRIVGEAGIYQFPRVSPDGKWVVVSRSGDGTNSDIWILGAEDRSASRFSFDKENEAFPIWSPRGDEVAYTRTRDDRMRSSILRKGIGGRPQLMVELQGLFAPTDWSPDGSHLSLNHWTENANDVVVWSLAEKKLIEVAASPAAECCGVFSPDGRWIAYHSAESGRPEIYVQPFPPTGDQYQLSSGGGADPRWTRAGEIAWADPSSRIHVVQVETDPVFRVSRPEMLFASRSIPLMRATQFDVMPDGTVVVNEPVRESRPLKLLVNWTRKLE